MTNGYLLMMPLIKFFGGRFHMDFRKIEVSLIIIIIIVISIIIITLLNSLTACQHTNNSLYHKPRLFNFHEKS